VLAATIRAFFTEVDRAWITVVAWIRVEVATSIFFHCGVAVVNGAFVAIVAVGIRLCLVRTVEGLWVATVDGAWVRIVAEESSCILAYYLTWIGGVGRAGVVRAWVAVVTG
jgi:hypothetical protein